MARPQAVATVRSLVKGAYHVSTIFSHFFVYKYGPPTPGQKYRDTSQAVVYLAQIKKRRCRPEFWRDNAVIKDSSFEERVIKDFEGKKLFGNLS